MGVAPTERGKAERMGGPGSPSGDAQVPWGRSLVLLGVSACGRVPQ